MLSGADTLLFFIIRSKVTLKETNNTAEPGDLKLSGGREEQ